VSVTIGIITAHPELGGSKRWRAIGPGTAPLARTPGTALSVDGEMLSSATTASDFAIIHAQAPLPCSLLRGMAVRNRSRSKRHADPDWCPTFSSRTTIQPREAVLTARFGALAAPLHASPICRRPGLAQCFIPVAPPLGRRVPNLRSRRAAQRIPSTPDNGARIARRSRLQATNLPPPPSLVTELGLPLSGASSDFDPYRLS
jgi:hypothetical protein